MRITQIRSAYRRGRAQTPPRQAIVRRSEIELNLLCKIGNAYEILSIPTQRHEYDYGAQQRTVPSVDPTSRAGFQEARFAEFFRSTFISHDPFHDPFQIFGQVFREEFGDGGPRSHQQRQPQQQ
jgi:DnaJ-class molecular chaperone